MRKNADLELIQKIDDILLDIEGNVNNKAAIYTLINEIRKKMYKYKTTKMQLQPKPIKPEKLIKMMYSQDIERLFNSGFTDTQIATITGVTLEVVQDYLRRKGLIQ